MQTTFVVAEIWSEPTDERIMDGLRKALLNSKAGMYQSKMLFKPCLTDWVTKLLVGPPSTCCVLRSST